MTATWQEFGISGSRIVRDLWQQKDVGTFDRQFTTKVPAHGAVMFRVRAK
jgi:alpha-galactosidase